MGRGWNWMGIGFASVGAGVLLTVVALLFDPFSKPLMAVLIALIGLFFAMAGVALALTFVLILAQSPGFRTSLVQAWIVSALMNRTSGASDPGRLRLSREKIRRLHPELFVSGMNPLGWLDRVVGARAARLFEIDDQLQNGDSRAAVVLSASPLLVAAYTDELDCIALLRFPDELACEYGLKPRDRLLTVNRYWLDGPHAPDLENGPLSYGRYVNFIPMVADFLTDDAERLRERKREIRQDEWTRAWVLGQRYLERHGAAARDGRPLLCDMPAKIGAAGG